MSETPLGDTKPYWLAGDPKMKMLGKMLRNLVGKNGDQEICMLHFNSYEEMLPTENWKFFLVMFDFNYVNNTP